MVKTDWKGTLNPIENTTVRMLTKRWLQEKSYLVQHCLQSKAYASNALLEANYCTLFLIFYFNVKFTNQ